MSAVYDFLTVPWNKLYYDHAKRWFQKILPTSTLPRKAVLFFLVYCKLHFLVEV